MVSNGFSLSPFYAINTEDFPGTKMSQKMELLDLMLMLIYLLL